MLGRGEDDRIATSIVLPPPSPDLATAAAGGAGRTRRRGGAVDGRRRGASTGGGEAEAPARPKPVFTPERPMRLWIAGDSLSIVPGEALLRLTAGNDAVEPVGADRASRAGSPPGLERPDRYDWFTRIQKEMKGKNEPGRRGADVRRRTTSAATWTGLPEGEEKAAFGTPDWIDQYRERVAGVMDMVTGNGKRNPPRLLVWIGVPIVNDEGRNDRYKTRQRDRPGRGGAPRPVASPTSTRTGCSAPRTAASSSACRTRTASCRRCAAPTACTSSRPAATSSRRP